MNIPKLVRGAFPIRPRIDQLKVVGQGAAQPLFLLVGVRAGKQGGDDLLGIIRHTAQGGSQSGLFVSRRRCEQEDSIGAGSDVAGRLEAELPALLVGDDP